MNQKKLTGIVGFFILVLVLHGQIKDETQWQKSIMQHRHQKDLEFKTAPTSPMAAVKRLVVKPGPKTFVVETKPGFTLSQQQDPGVQFSLINQKGEWTWHPHTPVVTAQAANKPMAPGSPINQYTLFQGSKWLMAAYPSKDQLVLIVFDPRRPETKHFSHLFYFPPAYGFAVPAVLKKFPKITKTTMLTSQNLEKTFYRYAGVHFTLEGEKCQLIAFKYALQGEDSGILFIPFADKTNGKETYGSGRFLEIPEPGDSNFILDFNLCFNPLCNYSPDAYNCPIPPFENILEIPVKAGEKTYPHPYGMGDR